MFPFAVIESFHRSEVNKMNKIIKERKWYRWLID